MRKRDIINEWDGKKETFEPLMIDIGERYKGKGTKLDAFHMNDMSSLMQAYRKILEYFNNEQHLVDSWKVFQSKQHSYLETDLLDNPHELSKLVKHGDVYLWLSDIAGWRSNILGYGFKNLKLKLADIIKCLQDKNLNGYVDVKDPASDLQLFYKLATARQYFEITDYDESIEFMLGKDAQI